MKLIIEMTKQTNWRDLPVNKIGDLKQKIREYQNRYQTKKDMFDNYNYTFPIKIKDSVVNVCIAAPYELHMNLCAKFGEASADISVALLDYRIEELFESKNPEQSVKSLEYFEFKAQAWEMLLDTINKAYSEFSEVRSVLCTAFRMYDKYINDVRNDPSADMEIARGYIQMVYGFHVRNIGDQVITYKEFKDNQAFLD